MEAENQSQTFFVKLRQDGLGNTYIPTLLNSGSPPPSEQLLQYLLTSDLSAAAIERFIEAFTNSAESRGRALSVAEAFVFAQLWVRGYLDSFTSEPASEHAIYESGYAFGYAEGQHPIEDNDYDYINK